MGKTKKIGVAGKFGARYGKKQKEEYKAVMELQKAKYVCPECSRKAVVREAAGIWVCKKCGAKFAGGAYTFRTVTEITVTKTGKGEKVV